MKRIAASRGNLRQASGPSIGFRSPVSPPSTAPKIMQAEAGQFISFETGLECTLAKHRPSYGFYASIQAFLDHSRAQLLKLLSPQNQLHKRVISSKTGVLKTDQITAIPGTRRVECSDTNSDVEFYQMYKAPKFTIGIPVTQRGSQIGWRRYKPRGRKSRREKSVENAAWCMEREILLKMWGRLQEYEEVRMTSSQEKNNDQNAARQSNHSADIVSWTDDPFENSNINDDDPSGIGEKATTVIDPALLFEIPSTSPHKTEVMYSRFQTEDEQMTAKDCYRLRKKIRSLCKKYELILSPMEDTSRSPPRRTKKRKASALDDLESIAEAETEDEDSPKKESQENGTLDVSTWPNEDSISSIEGVFADQDSHPDARMIENLTLSHMKLGDQTTKAGSTHSKNGDNKRLRLLLFGPKTEEKRENGEHLDDDGDITTEGSNSSVEDLTL